MRDSGRAVQLITRYKGKDPFVPDYVDTLADDELSSSNSASPSLSLTRMLGRAQRRSCKRPSSHPAFSDAVSGASHRTRRGASRRQNQLDQALGNTSVLPCDTPKPKGPYTQIPCCDTPKSGGLADNSSTHRIFVVSFLNIFLTNIQILIIFYKTLMYNSFTLLQAKIY